MVARANISPERGVRSLRRASSLSVSSRMRSRSSWTGASMAMRLTLACARVDLQEERPGRQDFVETVLDAARRRPDFRAFYDALPVAGVDGTLSTRMIG